jgi:hypothetical protein
VTLANAISSLTRTLELGPRKRARSRGTACRHQGRKYEDCSWLTL